jgi:hypothetical protein
MAGSAPRSERYAEPCVGAETADYCAVVGSMTPDT